MIVNNWKKLAGVGLIITLSLITRFYQLGSLPVILNRDEAALAYNALLLSETGTDEWGRAWPLSLESFGDYKLPGYPFLLSVLFRFFEYQDWIVRLPTAVSGISLGLIAYVWVKSLNFSARYRWLAALLIALTPVFIFYSRMAWEATLSLSFFASALYLIWLKPTRDSKNHLSDLAGLLLSVLAIFTYNTPFIVLPFIIPLIPILRGWKQAKKWALPVAGLTLVFLFSAFIFIPLTSQKSGITIFSDATVRVEWLEYRASLSGVAERTLGNKYLYFVGLILQRGIATISPDFMVIQGGTHPWHQVPGTAHFFWIQYLIGVSGLVISVWALVKSLLAKEKIINFKWLFVLYLLGVSLIPSLITVDAPHATRSLLFFWCFICCIIYGSRVLVNFLTHRAPQFKVLVISLISLLFLFETSNYLYQYFIKFPTDQNAYKPGLAQALQDIETKFPGQNVAVVDPDGYHYILVAWYAPLTPDSYYATVIRQQPDRIGFKYGQQVGKYHFVSQAADRQTNESVVLEWQDTYWQIKQF